MMMGSLKRLLVGVFFVLAPASVACVQHADLLKRASSGDAEAQFNLGVMYANGEGVVEE